MEGICEQRSIVCEAIIVLRNEARRDNDGGRFLRRNPPRNLNGFVLGGTICCDRRDRTLETIWVLRSFLIPRKTNPTMQDQSCVSHGIGYVISCHCCRLYILHIIGNKSLINYFEAVYILYIIGNESVIYLSFVYLHTTLDQLLRTSTGPLQNHLLYVNTQTTERFCRRLLQRQQHLLFLYTIYNRNNTNINHNLHYQNIQCPFTYN